MSTLGDLLAEHTMLPGNAVDHCTPWSVSGSCWPTSRSPTT